MLIDLNLITGLMLGFEYVDMEDEGEGRHLVFDILFVRVLVTFL
jgi:hypothetical protein